MLSSGAVVGVSRLNTRTGAVSTRPRTEPARSWVSTSPCAMMVMALCGSGIETRCAMLPKLSRNGTASMICGISMPQLTTFCPSKDGGVRRRL